MIKQNGKKIAKFSIGIILYEGLLTGVYPLISENPDVTKIAEAMPSAVKSVFGISEEARVDTFEAYISGQFFARIWAMLMVLYNVETANELLAKMVDDGTIGFLLSTPVPRAELFSTQALLLFSGNALLVLCTLLGLYGGAHRFGIQLKYWRYWRFAILGFAFYSFIGAYSLFFSALYAKGDLAVTSAAGVTLTCYAMDVAGGLNEKLACVRSLSLFRCYQPQGVLEGTVDPAGEIAGLVIGTLILLGLGKHIFEEKDLAV